jgi:uncharacterized membrane protein
MTASVPPTTPPVLPAPRAAETSGPSIRRIVTIAAAGLIGVFLLLFIIAVVLSVINIDQAAPIVRMIRDLVIIFLAIEGILIVLALAVLILQVARLINLLQTEVRPILENTQEAVETARGTIEFVGANVTEPLIRTSSFLSGLSVMVYSLFGIRRAVRRRKVSPDEQS